MSPFLPGRRHRFSAFLRLLEDDIQIPILTPFGERIKFGSPFYVFSHLHHAMTHRDIVIRKQKPSVFFGTTLMSYLTELHIDTLIVGGTTTSGCVRATVLDAFSFNFKVSVVEECTFDRGQVTHKINLFDMNAKYADVISLEEAEDYLAELPDNLFKEVGTLVRG